MDTFVLGPADAVRGMATVDGQPRVVVVTDGRVVVVPPAGLLRPALAQARDPNAAGSASDPAARRRKVAMWGGIGLGAVATIGSIVAGVVADRQQKKAASSVVVDDGGEDGATWDGDT